MSHNIQFLPYSARCGGKRIVPAAGPSLSQTQLGHWDTGNLGKKTSLAGLQYLLFKTRMWRDEWVSCRISSISKDYNSILMNNLPIYFIKQPPHTHKRVISFHYSKLNLLDLIYDEFSTNYHCVTKVTISLTFLLHSKSSKDMNTFLIILFTW